MADVISVSRAPFSVRPTSARALFTNDGRVAIELYGGLSDIPVTRIEHQAHDLLRRSDEILYLAFPGGTYAIFARALRSHGDVLTSVTLKLPGLSSVLGAAQSVNHATTRSLNVLGPGFLFGFPSGVVGVPIFGAVPGAGSTVDWQIAELERQIERDEWQIFVSTIAAAGGSIGVVGGIYSGNGMGIIGAAALAVIAYTLMKAAEHDISKLKKQIDELRHQNTGGKASTNASGSTSGSDPGGTSNTGSSGTISSSSASGSSTPSEDRPTIDRDENRDCTGNLITDGSTEIVCHNDSFPNPEGDGSGDHNPRASAGDDYYPNPEGDDPGSPRSRTWTLLGSGEIGAELAQGIALSVKTRQIAAIQRAIRGRK